MSKVYSFTKIVNSDGGYIVHDAMSNLVSIGEVWHVRGRGWGAFPHGGEKRRRIAFPTLREAAHALARYLDTGDDTWIFPGN